jgi:hypothetical protein
MSAAVPPVVTLTMPDAMPPLSVYPIAVHGSATTGDV